MADLNQAYQEVKSLPDEVLSKELSQPTGSLPGYIVMAEMQDREALRSTTSLKDKKPKSMKDELLSKMPPPSNDPPSWSMMPGQQPQPPQGMRPPSLPPQMPPPQQFAQGGVVGATNDFYMQALARGDPEMARQLQAQMAMNQNGGSMVPQPLQAPAAAPAPAGLASLVPTAPSAPPELNKLQAGLGSL